MPTTPLTPDWLKTNYLGGIPTVYPDGSAIPDEVYQSQIDAAIGFMEDLLSIVLSPQTVTDEKHDSLQNSQSWPNFAPLTLRVRPVRSVTEVRVQLGDLPIVRIPLSWVNLDKTAPTYGSQITIIPTTGTLQPINGSLGLPLGLAPWNKMPLWWRVDYLGGVADTASIPPLVLSCIGNKASLLFLELIGPGLSGYAGGTSVSVGADGLSTNIGINPLIYIENIMKSRQLRLAQDTQAAMAKTRRIGIAYL